MSICNKKRRLIYSVLTRILPWQFARPSLEKNRGPVRMLEGQKLKVTRDPWRTCKKSFVVPCGTNNLRLHSKRFLTWSTYLIQHGRPDVYDHLRFDRDAYANLHCVHGTNVVKGNKSKGFKFFDKCFYSFEQAKCWGVRLTFKLLINIEKSAWLEALLLHPNGCIFLAFGAPSQFWGRGLVRTLHIFNMITHILKMFVPSSLASYSAFSLSNNMSLSAKKAGGGFSCWIKHLINRVSIILSISLLVHCTCFKKAWNAKVIAIKVIP